MDDKKQYFNALLSAWNDSADNSIIDGLGLSDQLKNIVHHVLVVSTHKTYKYIFVNALLGAVNGNNPLVLQKQAGDILGMHNSWDARSFCHKVLVPFEREYMDSRLGASNEPFLNKPARFMSLSKENAVRRGSDRETLLSMIDFFESCEFSGKARQYLVFALYKVREILVPKIEVPRAKIGSLDSFPIEEILAKSCEGESLVFVTGVLLQMLNPEAQVVCHKSNQSGASSGEVGDIDIFSVDGIVGAVEVKDKRFTISDVEHAKMKASQAGLKNFLFVSTDVYVKAYYQSGTELDRSILSIDQLLAVVRTVGKSGLAEVLDLFLPTFLETANPKMETITHINSVMG